MPEGHVPLPGQTEEEEKLLAWGDKQVEIGSAGTRVDGWEGGGDGGGAWTVLILCSV